MSCEDIGTLLGIATGATLLIGMAIGMIITLIIGSMR